MSRMKLSIIVSGDSIASALRRPSRPILAFASASRSANLTIASAMSRAEPGSNSSPVRPSSTSRGLSLTRLANTGTPQAMASPITLEVPSW